MRDIDLFLTTLPAWDKAAFLTKVGSAPGTVAAVRVEPLDRRGWTPRVTTEAIGELMLLLWPRLAGALASFPGSAAQRSGWDRIFVHVPHAEPNAVGEHVAGELRPLGGGTLELQLVALHMPVEGIEAATDAIQQAECELERWHHNQPAIHYRWPL